MSSDLTMQNSGTKALIFLGDQDGANAISRALEKRGIQSSTVGSLEQCVDQMKMLPPDILIVEDNAESNIGIKAVREALRISWTVSPILISPLDEEQIHDRAEGLGILGFMSAPSDIEKLDSLIDVFMKLHGK